MHPTGDEPLLAGRYRLIGLLGRGGMAEVFDGFDERLARPVAIKLLRPEVSGDPAREARFAQEARSAARLSHPNVVAVYDSGTDNGRAYLIMERLPGTTLSDRIREGRIDQAWLATMADQVLAALSAAHDQGMVHRDIKPANILLTDDGTAKVGDFGIAKTYRDDPTPDPAGDLTATGLILGTVAYLSPEQIDGQAASPRSDLYALGVVLYEALTGQKPFQGANAVAQAHAAVTGGATPIGQLRPDVSPALAGVVERAMARRADDRFQTAAEMRAALAATGLVATTGAIRDPFATTVMPRLADGSEDPTGEIPPTIVNPAAATTVMGATQVAPRPRPPQRIEEEDDGRGERGKIWAIIIGTIVLLAVIGGVTYAIYSSESSSNNTHNPATTTTSTTPKSTTTVKKSTTTQTTTATSSSTSPSTAATTTTTVPVTTTTTTPATTTTTTASTTTTTPKSTTTSTPSG